jgi:hypothetical protein
MSDLRRRSVREVSFAILLLALTGARNADAQDAASASTDDSYGLPHQVEWKFNFDATWGVFGFGNSLFTDPKEGVRQNYGDRWMEGSAKPALSGTYKLSSSELYGKASVVGERTYANPPPLVGPVEASFGPEDLYIGWRSGKTYERLGENALDVTVGRSQYTVGHGFLLWDGAAEGGSRGGYWSNVRKAWEFAAIVRFKPAHHTLETFYLKKDDLPEHKTGSKLWGANYEFRPSETTTIGATYLRTHAKADVLPERTDLNVYDVRAFTAPIPAFRDLSFELEYAAERKRDEVHANAWTAQAAYQFSSVSWKPKLSYRYAFFQGDDPATARIETWDPLFPGFYDWGTWWQGEIAGEYFLPNSNLISHVVRAHVVPSESVSGGLFYYKFLLDEPPSFGPGVTDKNIAAEVDAYTDWKINKHFTASFVLAFADPQGAVEQSSGRTQNFRYGMVFLAYSY